MLRANHKFVEHLNLAVCGVHSGSSNAAVSHSGSSNTRRAVCFNGGSDTQALDNSERTNNAPTTMASPPRNHRDLWGFETHERVPDCLVEIRSRAEREWSAFTEANGEAAAAGGSAEAKELVRRCGICPSKRRGLWMVWSGAQALKEERQARYSSLVHKASEPSYKEQYAAQFDQVEVDLERTFPDHPHFRKSEESAGLDALRRILTAFILDSPEVGYTQSMNYIAAFMMLVVELDGRTALSTEEAAAAEEDAFWLTYALCRRAISGYHSPDVSSRAPTPSCDCRPC